MRVGEGRKDEVKLLEAAALCTEDAFLRRI